MASRNGNDFSEPARIGLPTIYTVEQLTAYRRLASTNRRRLTQQSVITTSNLVSITPDLPAAPEPSNGTNPYFLLPVQFLDAISRLRDIALPAEKEKKCELLLAYDNVYPEWSQRARAGDNFRSLYCGEIAYYGACHGVDYRDVYPALGKPDDMIAFTSALVLRKTPGTLSQLECMVSSMKLQMVALIAGSLGYASAVPFLTRQSLERIVLYPDYDPLTPEIKKMADRYMLISTHPHASILAALYELEPIPSSFYQITVNVEHPLERCILSLDVLSDNHIINSVGMCVPPTVSTRRYIEENIADYRKIFTRGDFRPPCLDSLRYSDTAVITDILDSMTDKEIFTYTGVYLSYGTRRQLVERIAALFYRASFFVSLDPEVQNSVNKETIMGTAVKDSQTFMIAFGTVNRYYTYELEDLSGAFYTDSTNGAFAFRHPEEPLLSFTGDQIKRLEELLTAYPLTAESEALLAKIAEGRESLEEKALYDEKAKQSLSKLSKKGRVEVQDFLRHLFETGMYMRRWQGPPHPYPLTKSDTEVEIDPDVKSWECIEVGDTMLKKMAVKTRTFCTTLRLIEYNCKGGLYQYKRSLGTEWKAVRNRQNCIRMSSSLYVGTAHHYLRVLFGESIPGFHKDKVARID